MQPLMTIVGALRRGHYVGGLLLGVARAIGGGHYQRGGAVVFHATVVEMERLAIQRDLS